MKSRGTCRYLSSLRGFTLVETLVVMVILSVVMMAAMSLIVPAKRSSVVQSDLSLVQGGMRFALDVLSRDLRNAGFLVAEDAVEPFTSATSGTPGTVGTWEASDLAIRIRSAVSGRMGYVASDGFLPASADQFQLSSIAQASNFRVDDLIAFFDPLDGTVVDDDPTLNVDKAFKVKAIDAATGILTIKNSDDTDFLASSKSALLPGTDMPGYVLLRVNDVNNTVKTIVYSLGPDDTLQKQIVGEPTTQYLAQGITGLKFTVTESSIGPQRVTVELTGLTVAASSDPNDPVGSAKTRTMRTIVGLRNL